MSHADATPPAGPHDPSAQLRHDLLTPVTVIAARASLLTRAIARSPSLTVEERARMLVSTAAIDDAARSLCDAIDGIGARRPGGEPNGRRSDSAASPARRALS